MKKIVFLKLGGSLITNKARAYTSRPVKINDLARQIALARKKDPELVLLLGHGSGSFGHTTAEQHGTREGIHNSAQWRGFAEVWFHAARLNHLLIKSLHEAGLPAINFPPSSCVIARDGKVHQWDLAPLQAALSNGLLPVIHGDAVFDLQRGGTILSTEDLFEHLARKLFPQRILLAGREEGVWADFPKRRLLVKEIIPGNFAGTSIKFSGTRVKDVTGGMESKVKQMLALVEDLPGLEVLIFSGEGPHAVSRVLGGESSGTTLRH